MSMTLVGMMYTPPHPVQNRTLRFGLEKLEVAKKRVMEALPAAGLQGMVEPHHTVITGRADNRFKDVLAFEYVGPEPGKEQALAQLNAILSQQGGQAVVDAKPFAK